MTDIQTLRQQLLQLRQLHESGVLELAAFEASKATLERKLLDAVMAAPADFEPQARAESPAAAPVQPRVSPRVWGGVAAVVVGLAALGYWWTGTSGEQRFATAAGPGAAEGAASAPHALGTEQVTAMVEKLAARLQTQPDDAEGWGMLGRSYMSLGRHSDALQAYDRAMKLQPNDATTLADYADALGVKNGRTLEGEPTRLIERALKLEPNNLKALALAGTAAFNRKDYVVAVKYWDHAVRVGPADSSMVEMARSGAAEARELGKLPPAPPEQLAAAAPANPVAAAMAGPTVKGTVRLSPALKAQASPEDTVFIFARPADGSRMPLAIARKLVKDLPAEFVLDDSTSMSPAAKLSGAKRVIVGARISKSGQAMPQPGDLEGLSGVVDVGATGVTVEISSKLP